MSEENGQTSTAPVSEEPVKNEKKPGMKMWGIIAGIVVIIAIAAAVLFSGKKDPKDTVIKAFKSIYAEGQTDPMEQIFGWKEMSKKLSKESSSVGMELQFENSSEESLAQLTSGKIGVTVLNDVENKKMFMSMGADYADMNLANMLFYLDDKQLVVSLPELSKKAFTLNYAENLEEQISKSPYIGQMIAESGVDIAGFENYLKKCNEIASSGTELFNVQELWNRYKEGSKAIDDLKAAMTVQEADKKSFTINGKEQDCSGYEVTITRDALVQFLTTTKEFFLADETLKKDFVEYMTLVTQLQGNMPSELSEEWTNLTPEQIQEKAWKDAEEQTDNVIKELKESMGDVALTVYVTKEGKMASFDYSTVAKIQEEDVKLYGTVTFAGGYNMMANVSAVLNIEDASKEVATIKMDKTGEYKAGQDFTGTLSITAGAKEETYGMLYNGSYSEESGAYKVSVDLQENGNSAFLVTSSGAIQDLEKGKSFKLVMDSLKMETNRITGENQFIELSGSYNAGPLNQEIEMPTGESFDVLAGTEEEWNTVFSEVLGNAYSLMMSVAK